MDVSEMLKKAWTAVEDAGLPDEIRGVAFREAMRVLVPTQGGSDASRTGKPAGAGTRGGGSSGKGSSGDGGFEVTEDEIYEKVVAQTGADREKLAELVHLDADDLKISIPGMKLGKNNAEKTRAVAQILTIVRGFGFDESETAVEVVRNEVIRLKCYDQSNFSAHLGSLNGYLITGSGTNKRIRPKTAGIQAFAAFVDGLVVDS